MVLEHPRKWLLDAETFFVFDWNRKENDGDGDGDENEQ